MLEAVVGYIDVGTGSYLLTAIAGGFATVWFFLRAKIDKLLGRRVADRPADSDSVTSPGTAQERAADPHPE